MRYLLLLIILSVSPALSASTPRQQALLGAAEAIQHAVPLALAEISYQASRPATFLAGDPPAASHAGDVLCDGSQGNQGLIWPAGEPLTIDLDLNSPHRLRRLQVDYGCGDGYEAAEATVEALDRQGEWQKLGALVAGQAASSASAGAPPALLACEDKGEYQRLRLVYPELKQRLWLTEIEVAGDDAALLRAAERFRTLAADPAFADFGLVSQLAMALRVRRMVGDDRALQERALTKLADFCSLASGITVKVELPQEAPPTGAVAAQVVVGNRGGKTLEEGSIKLKLPPGWSAAPGKFELSLAPRQTVRLPVTLTRTAEGRLTLLLTGLIDGVPLFMSRQD